MSGSGRTVVRIASAGVGYSAFMPISVWLGSHLIEEVDDLVYWLDYHLTATWFRKGIELLREGEADLALLNTRGLGSMAMRGVGLFDEPFAGLRAIATFPHHDWLMFCVDRSFGVRTFAELRERKPPIRLTTGFLDGDNAVGYMAVELLKRHGIDPAELEQWGGKLIPTGLFDTFQLIERGEANAICQEGVFTSSFRDLMRQRPMHYLQAEPQVIEDLRREWGWEPLTVPANFYVDQPEPLVAPDYSAWPLCVREDFDEELAYTIARIVVDYGSETSQTVLPGGGRGVTLTMTQPPVVPKEAVDTSPVPLHPGAERLYRERGLL
jgi:TRAP-type uncharacterized transport system substrate-binding protein